MARLNGMINTEAEEIFESDYTENESLIEALETLIEMIQDDALDNDEIEVLDEAIAFIAEDFGTEEELTEKKMSAASKARARKYRQKNKAKLAMISKKKKRCMAKIAGKTNLACGSNGRPHKIDKSRSKAAKRGARSR